MIGVKKAFYPVCCHCGRQGTLQLVSCVVRGMDVPITSRGFKLTDENSVVEAERAVCRACGRICILCEASEAAISAEHIGKVSVMDPDRQRGIPLAVWRDPCGGLFALEEGMLPADGLIASPFSMERRILLK